ncbi:amidase family protein [Mycolicibacterium sp. P1-18]|uniref:amidase family protein n=1 Tax=Mycolicibacterium sp. P1-18 TaxID=2024615 RepID=UPI0011F33E1C|nr:amidase family protein [Mycolicibacterium sp. P1-18]
MTSARDTCERSLARAYSPTAHSAMITVTADLARRQAADSDARRERGSLRSPLDGVPVAFKDLFDVCGTVTTCGSALFRDRPAARTDSALVRRLGELGMVTVGKTNLSEFAFSGLGVNQVFGTPVNPLDPARVPGGSSSGAAVAVAVGVTPLAVGTDTSGSIRIPAAFTGCVGYRASHHRYGPNDFDALSPTLDSVGFVARSVADVRLVDHLLVGEPERTPVLRAVIPTGEWVDEASPGVRSSFSAAVDALRRNGVDVTSRELRSLTEAQHLLDTHGTIVGAEAWAAYGHLLAEAGGMEPATRRRLLHNADAVEAVKPLREAMPLLRSMFRAELAGAVLLCPTVRHEPPRIADLLASDAAYDAANASTLRTTMALSYLGACGVTLPVPGVDGGLPSGLLLSAPDGDDGTVLATAAVFGAHTSAG